MYGGIHIAGSKGADLRKVIRLAAMYDMLPCTVCSSEGPSTLYSEY